MVRGMTRERPVLDAGDAESSRSEVAGELSQRAAAAGAVFYLGKLTGRTDVATLAVHLEPHVSVAPQAMTDVIEHRLPFVGRKRGQEQCASLERNTYHPFDHRPIESIFHLSSADMVAARRDSIVSTR